MCTPCKPLWLCNDVCKTKQCEVCKEWIDLKIEDEHWNCRACDHCKKPVEKPRYLRIHSTPFGGTGGDGEKDDMAPWDCPCLDALEEKWRKMHLTMEVCNSLMVFAKREEIFEIVDIQRKYITIDYLLKQIRAQDKDFDPDYLKEDVEYLSVLEIALLAPPGLNIKKTLKK